MARPEEAETAADPESAARTVCLRLLTASPKTRAQLAAALEGKGVPGEVAERVLDRLAAAGLVDDGAFADAWVRSRHAGRGLARPALRAELRQRGVADETIDGALGRLDSETEAETARALVRRRLPASRGLAVEVRFRRLAGMLARKGYPRALAVRVVREELEAVEGSAGELPDPGDPED